MNVDNCGQHEARNKTIGVPVMLHLRSYDFVFVIRSYYCFFGLRPTF